RKLTEKFRKTGKNRKSSFETYDTAKQKKLIFLDGHEEYNGLNDLVLIGAKCENLSGVGELIDETAPKPGLVWEKGGSY
ncbi:MAG: hypothetical protein ACYSX1_08660, partial [Planctomycetota bacterium]